ncbi:hypothetical protein JHK85_001845 [Glycine max]|nr:hypothetical protein JHK85_001845 [Glycine max]
MANSGPNTNGSQFFLTYAKQPHLNGLYTVFGKVIHGFEVLDLMEKTQTGAGDRPLAEIRLNRVTIHANPLAVVSVENNSSPLAPRGLARLNEATGVVVPQQLRLVGCGSFARTGYGFGTQLLKEKGQPKGPNHIDYYPFHLHYRNFVAFANHNNFIVPVSSDAVYNLF